MRERQGDRITVMREALSKCIDITSILFPRGQTRSLSQLQLLRGRESGLIIGSVRRLVVNTATCQARGLWFKSCESVLMITSVLLVTWVQSFCNYIGK